MVECSREQELNIVLTCGRRAKSCCIKFPLVWSAGTRVLVNAPEQLQPGWGVSCHPTCNPVILAGFTNRQHSWDSRCWGSAWCLWKHTSGDSKSCVCMCSRVTHTCVKIQLHELAPAKLSRPRRFGGRTSEGLEAVGFLAKEQRYKWSAVSSLCVCLSLSYPQLCFVVTYEKSR